MGIGKPADGSAGQSSITAVWSDPTDPTSVLVTPETVAFTAGTTVWSQWVDLLGFRGGAAFWVLPVALGANTEVHLYCQRSDDGVSAVGLQRTDASITNGVYEAYAYAAKVTTGSSTLVAGEAIPYWAARLSRFVRLGIQGNSASGQFNVRCQRLG